MLRAIVEERPSATLAQIGAELKRRASIDAHEATVRKAFVAAGLRRVRGEEEVRRVARAVPNRYG
jgi:hypothetical protein